MSNSPVLCVYMASQTPILNSKNYNFRLSQLPHSNALLPIASKFTLPHKFNNTNIKSSIASQMPFTHSKSYFFTKTSTNT